MANMNLTGDTAMNLKTGIDVKNKIKAIDNNVNNIFSVFGELNNATLGLAAKNKFNSKAMPIDGTKDVALLQEFGFFDAVHSQSIIKNEKGINSKAIQNLAIKNLETINITRTPGQKVNTERIKDQVREFKSRIDKGESFLSFDVETLGGQDIFGAQRLDHMISYTFQEMDKDGVNETVESIIGLTPEQGKKYKDKISAIYKKPKSRRTSYDNVLVDQLSIMGHEKSNIIEHSPGLFKLNAAPEVLIGSESRAIAGIEELIKIGSKQVVSSGPTAWESELARKVTQMNQGMPSTAYNAAFDINVINQIGGMSSLNISIDSQTALDVIDPFNINKAITDIYGISALYNKEGYMNPTLGGLQQESLARHYVKDIYDTGLAHVSSTDTLALGTLLTRNMPVGDSENMLAFYEDKLSNIPAIPQTTNKLEKGQLYFMDDTQMYQGKNPLSFGFDPLTKSYRTMSGYDVKGKVITEKGFEGTPYKGRSLYQIEHKTVEASFAKSLFKRNPELQGTYGDIVGPKQLVIMTPIDPLDKTGLVAQKQQFLFFDTPQEVESMLGSSSVVGTWNSEVKMNLQNINDLNNYKRGIELNNVKLAVGTAENVIEGRATLEDLAEISHNRMVNDTASRSVRNIDYSNFISKVEQYDVIKELGGAKAVAKAIASNDSGQAIIKNPKVYGVFSMPTKSGTKLLGESMMNIINSQEYFESVKPIYQAVHEEVLSLTKDLPKGSSTSAKRNLLFTEGIKKAMNTLPFGKQQVKTTVSSMNKLQINVGGILQGLHGNNILDINMKYGANLLNKAFKMSGSIGDIDRAGGYDVLRRLMDIQKQEGFEGVFENIDLKAYANQGRSAKIVSEEMTVALRERVTQKRTEDFMFGRQNVASFYQDTLTPIDLKDINVKGLVSDSLNEMNKLNVFDTRDTDSIVAQLNEQFDMINMKDLEKSTASLGSEEKKYLMNNIDSAKEELELIYKDFARSLKDAKVNIAIDPSQKGSVKLITSGGQVTNVNLPGLTSYGANVSVALGDNEYALSNSLKAYKFRSSRVLSDITTETNIAAGVRGSMSFQKAVSEAIKLGEDPIRYIEQTTSRKNVGIMNKSILIDKYTPKVFRSQFEVDMSELIDVVPELIENEKFMGDLYKKSVTNKVELPGIVTDVTSFKEHMQSVIKSQKFTDKTGLKRLGSFGEISSTARSSLILMMKNIGATLADYNKYDESTNQILNNLGINLRDKRLGKGIFSVLNPETDALGALNNQTKTTVFQHDNRIMRSRASLEYLTNNLDVNLDPVITDKLERDLLTNVVDHTTGLRSSGGLILNVGALDQISYNKMLNSSDEILNKASQAILNESGLTGFGGDIDSSTISKNLKGFLENVNLHEQAGAMNPVLYDQAYDNQQFKTLIKDRQYSFASNKAHLLNFDLVDGKIKYRTGFTAKVNELGLSILDDGGALTKEQRANGYITSAAAMDYSEKNNFIYSVDDYIAKNSEAHIKGRFFSKTGRVVTESEVDELLKGKNFTTPTDVESFLNEKNITYNITSNYADITGSNKFLFANAEKGTSSAMIPGMGDINPQVGDALEKAGLGHLIGRKRDLEALESDFASARKLGLPEDIITGLRKGIMTERYSAKVLFEDMLGGKADLLFNPSLQGHSHAGAAFGMLMESYAKQSSKYKDIGFSDTFLRKVFGSNFKEKIDLSDRKTIMPISGRASDLKPNIEGLKEMFASEGLEMTESLLEGNIGSIYTAPVVNVYDDIAGGFSNTRAQQFIINQSQQEIGSISRSIMNIEKDNKLTPTKKKALIGKKTNRIKQLQRQKETAVIAMSNQKGTKISDITLGALNRERYSKEKIQLLNERLPSSELFRLSENNENLIFINGRLELDDRSVGKSMYGTMTDMFRTIAREGQGEALLSELSDAESMRLKALFPSREMTKGYARSLESFTEGSHALQFNQVKGKKSVDNLLKKGFVKRSLLDTDLEIGGIAKTLNMYEDNAYRTSNVYDLGESLGKQDRYLAIEKMAIKEVDGRYIKPPHIGDLSSLQRMLQQIDDLPKGMEQTDLIARAKGLRREIITKQQNYVSGKSSALSDELFNVRMSRSYRGKGAGMYLPLNEGNVYTDTATINSRSITERRSLGIYDDAAWMSQEAFSDMGYFEPENIKAILGEEATAKDMMKHLETEGALMLGTRQPEIREGSITPQKVFLNKNLAWNEIKTIDVTAKAMNLDHDGDQTAYASLEYIQGKNKYFYEQYVRGQEMPTQAKSYFADIEAGMAYRSSVVNRAYHAVTQDALRKEEGLSMGAINSVFDIASNETIGDVLYSTKQGIDKNIWEIEDDFKRLAPYLKDKEGGIKEAAELIQNIVPIKEQESMLNSLASVHNYQKYTMEGRSKAFASNIGEASIINRNLNEMYETLVRHGSDTESKSADIFKSVIYRAEEAAIGAKKISDLSTDKESLERATSLDVVERWKKNVSTLFVDSGNVEARKDMREWISDRLSKDLGGLEHQSYFSTRGIKESSIEEIQESFLNTITKISAHRSDAPNMKINTIGSRGLGQTGAHLVQGSSIKTNTLASDALEIASESDALQHSFKTPRQSVVSDMMQEEINMNPDLFDLRSEARSAVSTVSKVKRAGIGVSDAFAKMSSQISGSSLAKTALGLAATVVVAGMVGGTPVDMPESEGEIAPDYSILENNYEGMDTEMFENSPMQGYTINVRGNTQGKEQGYIMNQLNRIIKSQGNANVNVHMNVANSFETINQRDLLNDYGI